MTLHNNHNQIETEWNGKRVVIEWELALLSNPSQSSNNSLKVMTPNIRGGEKDDDHHHLHNVGTYTLAKVASFCGGEVSQRKYTIQ